MDSMAPLPIEGPALAGRTARFSIKSKLFKMHGLMKILTLLEEGAR